MTADGFGEHAPLVDIDEVWRRLRARGYAGSTLPLIVLREMNQEAAHSGRSGGPDE